MTFKDGNLVLGTAGLKSGSATLKLPNLPAGVHVISAFYSGDSNFNPHGSQTLTEIVTDFNLSVAPNALSVIPGQNATYIASIKSQNGFNNAVSLSCSGLPTGASCLFSPASVDLCTGSATSILNLNTVGTLGIGKYTITVAATSGPTQHSVALTLNVANFSVSASPANEVTIPGQSATYNLLLNAVSGVSDTVSLSCSGLPLE